jgi:hypothetical protein
MNWIMQLFLRRRLFGDLSAEIQEHLAVKINELITSGLSREEAKQAARRSAVTHCCSHSARGSGVMTELAGYLVQCSPSTLAA